MMMKLLLSLGLLLQFNFSYGKRFANGYAEFDLPPGWQCVIEGSEWVCQSENAERKKEAIIILAAKKRGEQDSISSYTKYLKQTKTYQLPGSKLQRSEPKSVKSRSINGHQWVDALHLASEVPGFYTRYLATVKADIGVAVTFSVTKSMYNAYKGIFDGVIASMRIFRQTNTKLANVRKGPQDENFEETTFIPEDEALDVSVVKQKKRAKNSEGDSDFFFIILLLAAVGFVLFKLKKGKGK